MEGLGIAAGIVAVVDLSMKVVSLLSHYRKAKHVHHNIARLEEEVEDLVDVLKLIERFPDDPNHHEFKNARELLHILDDYGSQLDSLLNNLDPGKARKAMDHFGIRALK